MKNLKISLTTLFALMVLNHASAATFADNHVAEQTMIALNKAQVANGQQITSVGATVHHGTDDINVKTILNAIDTAATLSESIQVKSINYQTKDGVSSSSNTPILGDIIQKHTTKNQTSNQADDKYAQAYAQLNTKQNILSVSTESSLVKTHTVDTATAQPTTKPIADCDQIHLPDYLSFSNLEICLYTKDTPMVVVDGEGKYGFVDQAGQLVIEPIFSEAWSFKNNIALVKKDDAWGYIWSDGSYLVEPQFDDAWGFYENFAKVKKGEKYGFINHDGKTVIPIKYDESGNWFENGVVAVAVAGKWGLIDKTGRLLTPMMYDYIGQTASDRIAVAGKVGDDTLYGFINAKGERVIDLQYTYAADFSNGTAYVTDKHGKELLIDIHGNALDAKVEK